MIIIYLKLLFQNGMAYVIESNQIKTAINVSEYDDKIEGMKQSFKKVGADNDK